MLLRRWLKARAGRQAGRVLEATTSLRMQFATPRRMRDAAIRKLFAFMRKDRELAFLRESSGVPWRDLAFAIEALEAEGAGRWIGSYRVSCASLLYVTSLHRVLDELSAAGSVGAVDWHILAVRLVGYFERVEAGELTPD